MNIEKIQIATFFTENDSNKFLSTLLPAQVIDIKICYDPSKKCLSYTIVFKLASHQSK